MPTLFRAEDQIEVPDRLPVIALRDLVFFPYMVLPLLIGRPRSVAALAEAQDGDGLVLLATQRDPSTDDPGGNELFRVGTVARLVQVSTLPDGTARVVLEGLGRARIKRLNTTTQALRASVELTTSHESEAGSPLPPETVQAAREVVVLYADYARLHERIPDELPGVLSGQGDRVRLAHMISGHLLLPAAQKQELLEAPDTGAQFTLLGDFLRREVEVLRIEAKLDRQIRLQLSGEAQPEFGPGLRALHREPPQPEADEWAELEDTLGRTPLPPQARDRAEKEMARLKRLNPVAPEAAVIRTYLDWLAALPWAGRSPDNLDVAHASAILDAQHFGLSEVKDRILDHVAVLSLVGEMRGPILCLVGPPGVGKTSLGRSIGDALGREFVRVSLGGIRDEAEIRGHRRTYVGALPGRVIQGMRRSGTTNPVFLLDEVDKLARDFHGDPGAALLEVLDPEQNRTFTDHYLELEYDLSDVLFIATANTLQGIPEPLRDRMEVIRLPGYLDTEKREIAQRFLWPRLAEAHGLRTVVTMTPEAMGDVIGRYTREAGVRELNRRLSRIARKLARQVADGGPAVDRVDPGDLRDLLGPPPYQPPDRDQEAERVGIANGLAWTAAGGEVLDVEVAILPGVGGLRLTGTLGDVMKESAQAAVTYARSRSEPLGLTPQFHEKIDVHIHIPEGATPKDGPSAGITIAVALISALTDTPTRADVAMTGEITLRGRVLGVGGVKEKAVAALRAGIRTVVLPAANASDLELLPQEVLDQVRFVTVRSMDEVMDAALVRSPLRTSPRSPDSGGLGLPLSHG
ncbi:MAG TPA: endopeptidase La [Longimicrobiales bacterium]|nr:endopeptidase La [Longimicrobiales bacterium]